MEDRTRYLTAFILAIINLQISVDIAVLLDIPIARQILGFIYLTIVPGAILLILFRLHGLDGLEKFLFSVGLSLVFVMFLGLTVNQIGLSFESLAVLSTPTLLLAMNLAVFFFCVLIYFLNKDMQWDKRKLNFSPHSVLTMCFPLLAILGTTLVNFNRNSLILFLMIGIIALTVLISSARARTNWALILFMITIAVLFQASLISHYIVGYDVHPAYHVFKVTQNNGVWNSIIDETDPNIPRTNQMLSTTIFPAIYSNLLNMEGTWIFKIVFPLMFALVPVGLYQLYQKYMEKKVAFVAAFFILADITFYYEMPGLPAQMIAELFLVLSLIVMFHGKIGPVKKMVFFTIFSFGIIVSHYGISYILMFLVFLAWLVPFLRKKQPKIKIAYVALFFVLAFSWYIYTSRSASFTSIVDMSENIYTSFWKDLLDPQSRQEQVLRGVGMGESAVSIGHWVGRGFHYAAQFFIVLGFLISTLKRTHAHNGFKFDREYIVMSGLMLTSLMLILVAPSFNLLNVTRLYHVSLLFLAPFCIIGGSWFFSILLKTRKNYMPHILTLIVVACLFLFETGFIWEITQDVSYSVPLSMYRMNRAIVYGNGYITESVDVASAEWLHSNIVLTSSTIVFADVVSVWFSLTSYAVFPRDQTEILTNATSFDRTNAYVYLRNFNRFDGKILGQGYVFPSRYVWNTSDINPRLKALDKIYSNGGSEIFFTLNTTSP